ncbi:MAG: hypothetical protein GF409_06855 [Candidatus Omnitrophica bacterium]|nr:hypothetical protein [Candidatus Omnitrophota bacterium]
MRKEKFIVTKELGKLAKWLRILGYDSVYYRDSDVAGLVIRALREKRILLTRQADLEKYKGIKDVIIEHDHVEDQLEQVTGSLGLSFSEEDMFRICVECNSPLEPVEKEKVKGRVPEYVYRTHKQFKQCPECDKIFWKGSHWDMVTGWLEKHGIEEQGSDEDQKNGKS